METLYRKYRPKNFSELIGQKHVKKIFINALENNLVSHAYIFAGPRGTGKTTVARILAKSLNCENRKGAEPCNTCSSCIAIDNGNFMDVYEIDAASNRGIDEIRKIREAVNYHAAQGKYKVYIIDEVHMLTKEAFNALLKTLEEPPENVVFILATTNPEKIPPTIISRCQIIDFKNIEPEKIIERLKYVSEKEKFKITDEAFHEIAKRANGGLRDALTILEQVMRYSNDMVTIDTIKEALGLVSDEIVEKLLEYVINGNLTNVLKTIEEVYFSGKDIEVFLKQIIENIVEKVETGNFKYIEILKPVSQILKDIKFSDEKLLLTKLGFLEITKSFAKNMQPETNTNKSNENIQKPKEKEEVKISQTLISPETPKKEKPNNSKSNEKIEQKEEKTTNIIDEIMEELKIKGDLSLYVALNFAKIKEDNNEITISFTPDKKIHYEIVKTKSDILEKLYLSKAGFIKPINIKISEDNEDDVLKKLKTLFGNNFIIEE
ncbi:MAG: DNA polymerase III subunit gamma/tau [Thermosipho sp. (in: Bacteria)]|nr:DNA polymerase III subunit gamma/tau [Thermosipho sp. (in: thermotogales)]